MTTTATALRQCTECSHDIAPRSEVGELRTAGHEVRIHTGRGLCDHCYQRARRQGRRAQHAQVRSGQHALRGYTTHQPEPSTAVGQNRSDEEREAARVAAKHVPADELPHVLAMLGLTGAAA